MGLWKGIGVGKKKTRKRGNPARSASAGRRVSGVAESVALVDQVAALAGEQRLTMSPRRSLPANTNKRVAGGELADRAGVESEILGHRGSLGGGAVKAAVEEDSAAGGLAVPTGCLEEMPAAHVGVSTTYELDARRRGGGQLVIRLEGRRIGGGTDPKDSFVGVQPVGPLHADLGTVSITSKVIGINPGQWQFTATPQTERAEGMARPRGDLPIRRFEQWTRPTPFLRPPGVYPLAWPGLVFLGVLVALFSQSRLLGWAGVDAPAALAVSVAAVAVGYLVAKMWYLVLHRREPRHFRSAGTCIQGFLIGCFGALALGAWISGIAVATLLDASTPGVFFAMALGRPGCFLGGCCAGRLTTSRWGLRSSDRSLRARRIPVQLIEAAAALAIGAATLAAFLTGPLPLPGALFAAAVAVYTVARQLLFPLRHEPRRTTYGRQMTLATAGLVASAAVLGSILLAMPPG